MDKNAINLFDTIIIIGLALLTNCFSEFLSFIFIYRKKQYKELNKNIEIQTKKIESLKASIQDQYIKSSKKEKKLDSELKGLNSEMMKLRMASTLIIGLFVIFFMSVFSSVYQVRIIIIY